MQQVLKSYFEVNVYVVLFHAYLHKKKKKKAAIYKNNHVNDNMIFIRDVSARLKGPNRKSINVESHLNQKHAVTIRLAFVESGDLHRSRIKLASPHLRSMTVKSLCKQ